MKISTDTLAALAKKVAVPTYDRSAVKPGILHIGVGNFHRAHQAVYANDLLNLGHDPSWGICGAGVRPNNSAMRARLEGQDWMSTVVETDADGLSASVIGSMVDFLPVTTGHGPIVDAITNPVTKIISLTVTEGGYYIDPATGVFDAGHSDITHDARLPEKPLTVFGAIVAGLGRRRALDAPVTVMSCDNLPGNGDVTRNAVLGLARAANPALADWIEAHVTFPNGMVDRITPATSEREISALRDNFGIEDSAPVFCEPFRQWVLEDAFAAGRPNWEAAGVTVTNNVHDYEAMKIRVLNGGHAIIAYAGGLAEIEFVHDAMANPVVDCLPAQGRSARRATACEAGRSAFAQSSIWTRPSDGSETRCGRYNHPALSGRIEPATQIHPAVCPRLPVCGARCKGSGDGFGTLVPILSGSDRRGRKNRAE